jgi:hypothetical protein
MTANDLLGLLPSELLPTSREALHAAAVALAGNDLGDDVLDSEDDYRQQARASLAGDRFVVRAALSEPDADGADHDYYFGVTRVGGDAAVVFLGGLLVTYLDALDNAERMGTGLGDEEWGELLAAPTALFDFALDRRAGRHRSAPTSPRGRGEYLPFQRWRVGHRLFSALIQSISVALGGLLRSTYEHDLPAMRDWVVLATPLVLGSAAALRLAADFEPSDYDACVRSGMEPPSATPAISFLEARDHRYLVGVLEQIRLALPHLEPVSVEYDEFTDAVQRLFEAHHWLTERFGQANTPFVASPGGFE